MTFLKKHKTKVFIAIMAIVAIIMFAFIGVSDSSAGAITTPMQTWGYAQFIDEEGHGEPVPIGTEVKVYIGSNLYPSGAINTTQAGFYGSMMVVGDESQYGEELHYTLDGY